MTRWLTLHRDDIPLVIFTVASISLATIVAINILNFYRVLVSDFLKVVGDGAIRDTTRRCKTSELVDETNNTHQLKHLTIKKLLDNLLTYLYTT